LLGDVNPIEFYDKRQLHIKQNFSQLQKMRDTYHALDLVHGPVHEAERNSSPATTTITKIDYNLQKITEIH
jgi:Cu/Ag efflux protein CusF